jgi:DNA-binding XRE family transcriptional regulator
MKRVETWSERLRAWRGISGADNRGNFTQRSAAKHLGVAYATYTSWEQGIRTPHALLQAALGPLLFREPSTLPGKKTPASAPAKNNQAPRRKRPASRGRTKEE